MKQEILTAIDDFIDENSEQTFHNISRLVAVNSIE